jgi:DNA-binding CsgD family transcriptional regulator
MVAFTDACLVHRAEIMQLHGAWADALTETRRACEASARGAGASPPAAALYREGEIHRLRGEVRAAEEAYRKASRAGWDPQPGLALLRLAQGRTDAACAAIRRALDAASEPAPRARLLPAVIEITIAAGDVAAARAACGELQTIADRLATELLAPCAACACGAVALAEGNPRAALAPLGRAFELWRALDAPYEAARARVLIGQACRALGDEESAALEIEAARAEFERLGAMPDLKRLDGSARLAAGADEPSLTPRERQVVRLIAAGKTNRVIAEELRVSERTVDRHVSNILTKLDVPSRAAATAWAYRHKLL